MNIFEDLELNERQKHLYKTSLFLGKMVLAGAVFQSILFIYPDTSAIQAFFAQLLSPALNLFGLETSVYNHFIGIGKNIYIISQDCLGWKSMAAFIALIYSSEGLRENLHVALLGSLLLAVANYIRVLSTIVLSEAGIISFKVVHGSLWKWGLTFLVVALWIVWLKSKGTFK